MLFPKIKGDYIHLKKTNSVNHDSVINAIYNMNQIIGKSFILSTKFILMVLLENSSLNSNFDNLLNNMLYKLSTNSDVEIYLKCHPLGCTDCLCNLNFKYKLIPKDVSVESELLFQSGNCAVLTGTSTVISLCNIIKIPCFSYSVLNQKITNDVKFYLDSMGVITLSQETELGEIIPKLINSTR
jgi:hypothetical protein